eukprot:g14360.t1
MSSTLLRAKANPEGTRFVPLNIPAPNGHLEIEQELIQEHEIEGCGGASGGLHALQQSAAENQRVDIMEVLTSAGVVDTGKALRTATNVGRESTVNFLLQQWKQNTSDERAG